MLMNYVSVLLLLSATGSAYNFREAKKKLKAAKGRRGGSNGKKEFLYFLLAPARFSTNIFSSFLDAM